jgi:hypothetical protein
MPTFAYKINLYTTYKKNTQKQAKKVLSKCLIFVNVKLSATAKGVIGVVTIAAAYRVYQLWKTGEAISYSVKNINFKRIDNRFAVVVGFDIFNPTRNSIRLKNVSGIINSGNFTLSSFQSGAYEIKPGHNVMPITFFLDSLQVVGFIANGISTKQYPIFNVTMTTRLALFSYTEGFNINTKDYAAQIGPIVFAK